MPVLKDDELQVFYITDDTVMPKMTFKEFFDFLNKYGYSEIPGEYGYSEEHRKEYLARKAAEYWFKDDINR